MNLFCLHCGRLTPTETIDVVGVKVQRFESHLRLITHVTGDPTEATFEQVMCRGSGVRVKVD